MANTRRGIRAGGTRPRRPTPEVASPLRGRSSRTTDAHRQTKARRILVPLALVGVVMAVLVGLVASSLASGGTIAREGVASTTVVDQATSVPLNVLTAVGERRQATTLLPVQSDSLSIAGKPGIVFVSEESCPFCAAERWPLVIALSHFGLRTTELANNAGHPLQTETPLDTELIGHYDVPPYVNSADQSGAVPFLDIDNHDILAGAQYSPQVLAGLSMSQIAGQLDDPASAVAMAIDESANALIAAIDRALHLTVPHG
jgi:hypothetical protein